MIVVAEGRVATAHEGMVHMDTIHVASNIMPRPPVVKSPS